MHKGPCVQVCGPTACQQDKIAAAGSCCIAAPYFLFLIFFFFFSLRHFHLPISPCDVFERHWLAGWNSFAVQ